MKKIRVRVDFSSGWKGTLGSIYVGLLATILLSPIVASLVAQNERENGWRRTNRGWEVAHAVQTHLGFSAMAHNEIGIGKNSLMRSSHFASGSVQETVKKWHGYALPVAVSCFFVSFGWWMLIGVENRGAIRLR